MFLKRQLPFVITLITSLILIISYFSPHPTISPLRSIFQDWYMIIVAFTMFVGILSLVKVSIKKIKREKGIEVLYPVITLVSLIVMAFFGFLKGGLDNPGFDFMFEYIMVPLQATMFSLLAFYIASASFRAFRAKSTMATILLITAFIVMLGRVPIGEWITGDLLHFTESSFLSRFHIPNVTEWIMNVINMAGQRAILIGAALGVMGTSIKIMLGIERSHLGGE
ncbi:MAG: hypothetical protein FXF47_06710 [Candidatus Mcinerneyibacterium aminivorans]|uniref:Uncharacterized protein n=1 Tax=Candidatus Mcinerneyibacterium aminivorans TaxID=2703815 RepID=A0A5D0MHG1_9BACT|nr:MAG: hypothetical protein FXF47_06710 [Candidatus Mcinerneyibacterium aminivorans]